MLAHSENFLIDTLQHQNHTTHLADQDYLSLIDLIDYVLVPNYLAALVALPAHT